MWLGCKTKDREQQGFSLVFFLPSKRIHCPPWREYNAHPRKAGRVKVDFLLQDRHSSGALPRTDVHLRAPLFGAHSVPVGDIYPLLSPINTDRIFDQWRYIEWIHFWSPHYCLVRHTRPEIPTHFDISEKFISHQVRIRGVVAATWLITTVLSEGDD